MDALPQLDLGAHACSWRAASTGVGTDERWSCAQRITGKPSINAEVHAAKAVEEVMCRASMYDDLLPRHSP